MKLVFEGIKVPTYVIPPYTIQPGNIVPKGFKK